MQKSIARLLSYLFHPLLTTPVILWVYDFHTGTLGFYKDSDISIIILSSACIVLPALFALGYYWSGKASSIYFENRKERVTPFLFTLVLYIVIVLALSSGFYQGIRIRFTLIVPLVMIILILSAGYMINRFFKISLHLMAWAGVAALLAVFHLHHPDPLHLTVPLALSILILPVVFWARYTLRAHSSLQLIAGGILGAMMMFAEAFILEHH